MRGIDPLKLKKEKSKNIHVHAQQHIAQLEKQALAKWLPNLLNICCMDVWLNASTLLNPTKFFKNQKQKLSSGQTKKSWTIINQQQYPKVCNCLIENNTLISSNKNTGPTSHNMARCQMFQHSLTNNVAHGVCTHCICNI